MSDIHNELLYARILWIGVIWIKIITAIDDTHVRLFFEVATINFTVFVIERSYRILIARYPKGTIDERILKALSHKELTQNALIDAVKANL